MNSLYPPQEDLQLRWSKVQDALKEAGADACLIASNVNIYYLTGEIFAGYVYLPSEGEPIYFVRRPSACEGEYKINIRKPEDIPSLLKDKNIHLPKSLYLESDQLTYNEFIRLQTVFSSATIGNATSLLQKIRIVKTPWEIDQFRISAKKHAYSYKRIPSLFQEGMTDSEFQYEIERVMRANGSLGIFRTFGRDMDIFMGSLLTGENAEAPSPFDFALGGAGLHPCLPIGASGGMLKHGTSVMVDMAGNFTAYMTDMTRVYSVGELPEKAYRAHQVSIDMHNRLMNEGKPGVSCADIYNWSVQMAEDAGLSANFMGLNQQAKFVGHGVGLEINEQPVLMGRSKDVLQPGMTIAFEPKFVLHGVGAVGIENTFLVTENGMEKLTVFEENIINLI